MPAPSANKSVVAVEAIPTTKSAISKLVELICVVVPSTNKSPLILTIPVLSPTTAGSIIKLDGPVIVAVSDVPLEIETPIPVVSNFLMLS